MTTDIPNSALRAGLELEFLAPDSAIPVSANQEFWHFFQESPPFIAIKARKVIQ